MKTFVVVCLLALSGCSREPAPLTQSQREAKWRDEIPFLIADRCTNDLVGFYRIIRSAVSYSGPPSNWVAEVSAEYINKMGGIERTNLPMKFGLLAHRETTNEFLWCFVDGNEVLNRTLKAAEIERGASAAR